MSDCYERLARFLDNLPAGYPRTNNGVELRILQKLFTPDEAELFMHLTLLDESAAAIALRAGMDGLQAAHMLAEMGRKGLVSVNHLAGDLPRYSANQFVVGFWEDQVNRLDREISELFEEYVPHYFDQGYWERMPQLRTIPVRESISVTPEVMGYEQAEAVVQANTDIAVRNCVCRQQQRILDHDCGKPLETCLSFGNAALNTVASGKGRSITRDEAFTILRQADRAGLVLQPANTKNPAFICACCGCCCGVLRGFKLHPQPASMVATAYTARYQSELCIDCGVCLDRCQLQALSQAESGVQFDPDRCIGCGLCVSTCPSGAMSLVRKAPSDIAYIPRNSAELYIRLGQKRHRLGTIKIVGMALKASIFRILVPPQD